MEPLIAVYDACVLYPNLLRDFLVRLAIHGRRQGVLRAKWTGRIHREWIGAVLRQRPELRVALRRTRQLMDRHVRGCRVRGYERWEQRLTLPDADDRHVLAAALACVADVIVTFNTADFPSATLAPFHIVAVEPDTFVCQLKETGIVESAAADHRASLTRPPMAPSITSTPLSEIGSPAPRRPERLSGFEGVEKMVSLHVVGSAGVTP